MNPILAHYRQLLSAGSHTFGLRWRILHLRPGASLYLTYAWSSRQPPASVLGPIAVLARAQHVNRQLILGRRPGHVVDLVPGSAPSSAQAPRSLASGRRVWARRSRSHATPAGRPRRGGRERDNWAMRKTAALHPCCV